MAIRRAISEPGQGRSWSWSWSRSRFLLALYALHALLLASVRAEPVQYCRFGDPARPNAAADFCLGLATLRNASTGAHDVYMTLTHTRPRRSAAGWTAVGTGDSMTGSLMFIIYGDPASGEKPIVSVRAATGHHQPRLLTRAQMSGGDLRVLRSDWVPATASQSVTASISLVCYSCTLWPGDGAGSGTLSAAATAQPWIWAWNQAQAFDVYSYDAHLRMHAHHAGNGGWGRFYVDMARADQSAGAHLPSVPVIRPGVAALGASELPPGLGLGLAGWMAGSPVLRLHGGLMALAFLAAFPPASWPCAPALASAAVAGGVAAGLALQREINTAHQVLGLALAGALGLQACLGWKHHVDFVRVRRRTYISYAHIWTGRAVMLGGQANLLLGLLLHGAARLHVGLVAAFIVLQSSLLAVWLRRRAKAAEARARVARYDALEANDDEDEEEESAFAIASPEEMDIGEEGMDLSKETK
ncbi:hypothetical protein ColKHC_06564 [Colletotrichum higginsianum]|nr:hypothetical protein ColKHC_06564 [Colletotrichum higginsianum]